MKKLTHINQKGDAQLVGITDKAITHRKAIAEGTIQLNKETLKLIQANLIKKGDVLSTAKIAGIQAAKKTWELIPLCHSINLTKIDINFNIDKKNNTIVCQSSCECFAQTGLEMEALSAVNIALLTIYDMVKAVDRTMVISNIHLVEKSGGRSGLYKREVKAKPMKAIKTKK
ncbi:cyclic pyranopterin monophosphate synthase MoaC [Candidatus Methylopumilus universalis]|uniref:Cyclic pyranopterin monophosphate synthase n=1 Tax=Candidatus Methylopumilus universalis TaxID=2588536 RepID=A0AAX1EXQ5_9PROT|nr:cyclic pyranopterin monophosphate synthase MoaC [Candidatus Methylopumilus universalis]QDC40605.1 cyclic pyranopterin monophosphate synthase MoaC [Candidatus Methylopumilus universalis]QDC41894.1 cyclic pyranopterin monophosphate synthase MoaC [Candidatus Methylopumilus universalis]QDC54281.1 cyclic pyranopterin monophosphate synthase MoaC [Candidatus Methylopumilus universalis]QDC55563.1 cyclic pyranopterin monophosphate synthase MoaC [Candidatus Methylopumilus universalis]QDC56844.1 cycli